MWFIRQNFEKIIDEIYEKGILKGIYCILTGVCVGILNEFGVVLLRDFFY
jgi:hypothetical protein